MDRDEKEHLITVTEQPKPKTKKTTLIKAHPLEATCNTFITLMVAVIAFLLILLIVDVGGLIDLSQIKTINNSNNNASMNGTSSTTNPIKFKIDEIQGDSTALLGNDVWALPEKDNDNNPQNNQELQDLIDSADSSDTQTQEDQQDENDQTKSQGRLDDDDSLNEQEEQHENTSEPIQAKDTGNDEDKGKTVNSLVTDDASLNLISIENDEHQFLENQRQFE